MDDKSEEIKTICQFIFCWSMKSMNLFSSFLPERETDSEGGEESQDQDQDQVDTPAENVDPARLGSEKLTSVRKMNFYAQRFAPETMNTWTSDTHVELLRT